MGSLLIKDCLLTCGLWYFSFSFLFYFLFYFVLLLFYSILFCYIILFFFYLCYRIIIYIVLGIHNFYLWSTSPEDFRANRNSVGTKPKWGRGWVVLNDIWKRAVWTCSPVKTKCVYNHDQQHGIWWNIHN